MQMFIQQLNSKFTDEEKKSCIPVIRRIIELAHLTRKQGILALEKEIYEEQSVFLKTGIQLIVDSIDSVRVEKLLQNLILAGNYSGSQLLERLIMMEGILGIQQGYNPHFIALTLLSIMGEEYLARIKEMQPEDKDKPYINLLSSFKGKETSPESVLFEKILMRLHRFAIIQVIRYGIDYQNLAYALYGCSIELICKVLDCVSHNHCMQICGKLMRINSSEQKPDLHKNVLQAQNDILKIIETLEKQGAIVIR